METAFEISATKLVENINIHGTILLLSCGIFSVTPNRCAKVSSTSNINLGAKLEGSEI